MVVWLFAEEWHSRELVQQAVAQVPWSHQIRVLDKVKDRDTRLF
jgi:hypothetical protein